MIGHDGYGKRVVSRAADGDFQQYGSTVHIDYGAGESARIDGTVGSAIAVEIESRTPKQVRGAVLDLICHPFKKKLLVILPVHMHNPNTTASQCCNILSRFCSHGDFRVVVLRGTGKNPDEDSDVAIVAEAVAELTRDSSR